MIIYDSHNDLLYKYKTKSKIKQYLNCIPTNVKKIFCAYFSYNESNASICDMKKKFSYLDSRCIKTIENARFLNTNNFEEVVKENVFCLTLCHNKNNKLCGGALDNGVITNMGYFLINELENNQIIIDTAHMNEQSFWDFVQATKYPIFNSHSGFFDIFPHKRNLKQNQIEEIVKSKGYIGLTVYPKFFSNNLVSSKKLVDAIFWFWNKYGTNTLGIGTDFNGIDLYFDDIKNYRDFKNLEIKLKERGAKKDDIQKLFNKNLKNYYKKIGTSSYSSIKTFSSL